MSSIVYSTNVFVCEGLIENFDLLDLLLSADPNYSGTNQLALALFVQDSNGNFIPAPADSYLKSVDGDTVAVDLTSMPDFLGTLSFRILATDSSGALITINVQSQIVPVNDAPEGSDGGTTIAAGADYVFTEADFGFSDPVDGDNFLGVVINTLPTEGTLKLDGVDIVAGQEISTVDINAGKFVFVPEAGQSGAAAFDFQVRDDGGVNECGGEELDLTPNTFTITIPPPEPAHIGDRVWFDENGNGVQDAGENGVQGVTVQLKDSNGNVIDSTTTDANGNYGFTVAAGTYSIGIVEPNGFDVTVQDAGGNDATDSDIDPATLMSDNVTVAAGETNNTLDAGLIEEPPLPAHIGDRVWFDENGNGVQDAGENGVQGVTVQLKDSNGNVIDSTTTDANGNYGFTVAAGTYSIGIVEPNGFDVTVQDAGGNDATDSDIDPATLMSDNVTVAAGETNNTLDAGLIEEPPLPAQIGDRVWFDENGNGVQDAGENGVQGVTVQLKDSNGNVIDSTTTDANGNYGFTVAAGTYSIGIVEPNGFDVTVQDAGGNDATDSDINPATLMSDNVTVAAGETNNTLDAGLIEEPPLPAHIGDRVWFDENGNGVQDAGENGVQGVTVQLKDSNGNVIDSTTTDANGNYGFTVAAGTYSIGIVEPNGFDVTVQDAGGNDATDSDINPATLMSDNVTVAAGETNNTLDAGLVEEPARLGDRVWEDTDRDGVQDANEAGIANVTVDLKDANGNVIDSTTTDANGNYFFDVQAGTYSIGVTPPSGYVVTGQNLGGNEATDSDLNPATNMSDQVTVGAGENYPDLDAGLYRLNAGIDIEKFVRIESPGELYQGKVCEDFGKPLSMTFEYAQGTTVSNTQDGNAKILGATKIDDDGMSWVVVSDKSDVGSSKKIYFEGYVAVGDEFTASAAFAGESKFASNAYIHYFDDNPNVSGDEQGSALGLLQSASYHASCSKPIFMGDIIGNSTLVGYVGKDGGEVPNSPPVIGPDLDADTAAEAPSGEVGVDTAVFTYEVTNTGEVALSDVQVTDDRLSNLSFVGGDSDGDNMLDLDETWIYTASETVKAGLNTNVGTATGQFSGGQVSDSDAANYTGEQEPVCISFDFSGDSSTDGHNGNIRTYTVNGVTVNVSAWAESKSSGSFSDAWLGAYGNGLGVTDDSEGSGSGDKHTVDNVGDTQNYVLFEFSQSVVIDRAYLGYVDDDSDIEVWIGTVDNPIGNHLDLNASVLGSLGLHEFNATTSSSARWADFNDGNVAGNVLVIAADTTDTSPEDEFKIEHLELCTTGPTVPTEPVCVTFDFSGNSSNDGPNGNIRTYTVDGITVNVSAFAEDSNGQFSSAWLGAFGNGLGVTDDSEGSGSGDKHTVDNVNWNNYLVFSFSQSVVIDKAYLGYVVDDSDIEVWIGNVNDPIGNPIDLNSSVLSSLGLHEFDSTSSSSARWADFNNGEIAGNVLVIAADTTDSTPEDRFKLEKLDLCTSEAHAASQPASAALPLLAETDMADVYANASTSHQASAVDLASLGTLLDDGGSLDALVGPGEAPSMSADSTPLADSYSHIASMNQLADVYEQALAA